VSRHDILVVRCYETTNLGAACTCRTLESGLLSCLMSLRARLPGPLLVTRPEHPSVSLLCKGRVADGCLVVVVYLCPYGDGAMRAPRRFFCLSCTFCPNECDIVHNSSETTQGTHTSTHSMVHMIVASDCLTSELTFCYPIPVGAWEEDGRTAEVVTCQPALPQILLVAPKAHCLRVEASLLVLSST
jgi:hypothetical protein